jgi:hypothetical protein
MLRVKSNKLSAQVFFVGKHGWQAIIQDATTCADLVVFRARKEEYAAAKHAVDELRKLADGLECRYRRKQ